VANNLAEIPWSIDASFIINQTSGSIDDGKITYGVS
jgi:hypothetical protein